MNRFDKFKEAGNPMFNDNKFKLGIFGPNVNNSCAMTLADTTFKPDYETNVRIAQMMENAGYECIVPVARWRGFGGSSNFNGTCMETFTWAAAMAAVTEKIYLFTTSHVPTVHPIAAAKMIATIDDISKGRIGLNTVVGWFPPEMKMFNGTKMDHATGYRYVNEWMDIVLKLWSEQYFDYEGEFFTIKDGWQSPKPSQSPRPVLISAGTSKDGRDYAARFTDFNFGFTESIDYAKEWTKSIKNYAWETYKRQINTFTTSFVVCRPTEKEAWDFYDYYVREQGDWEAGNIIADMFGIESGSNSKEFLVQARENFMAGWAGWPLVGTPEQVTEQIMELSDTGLSGSLISFLDYEEEMPYFNDNVLPMLEQAGYRQSPEKSYKTDKDSKTAVTN